MFVRFFSVIILIMPSLTDLTINEFQFIFVYLDYTDSISLGDTNMDLRNIVKMYLSSKLKHKLVLQCNSLDSIFGQGLIATKFLYILRFIRIFGDQITILVFWVTVEKKCQLITMYLSKYCHNLNTLLFRSMKFDLSPYLFEYTSIRNLLFEFSVLPLAFKQISFIFPNLENLSFFQTRFDGIVNYTEKHEHLECFIVDDPAIYASFVHLYFPIKCIHLNEWATYLIERKKNHWIKTIFHLF